jgi:sugar O-acyltransferase (sialic acid O-acetyltransferase NeuD family)
MKRLVIVGAGDLALEIACWLHQAVDIVWDEVGFIDDNKPSITNINWLGTIKDYIPKAEDLFVCGIANPKIKLKICKNLQALGACFINVIHKTAIITEDAVLGIGIVAYPFVFISRQTVLGDFINLNSYASIGHNAILGDGCTLSAHCDVTGHVKIGKGVFMGTHACIIPSIKIGDFSLLGAGAVVMRNIPDSVTVVGNPAKILTTHRQTAE